MKDYRDKKEGKYIIREFDSGTKEWYYKGELHREDGAAWEYRNGTKVWYINGKQHREDGPAWEYKSGTKEWWLDNKRYYKEKDWKIEMRRRKLELLGI